MYPVSGVRSGQVSDGYLESLESETVENALHSLRTAEHVSIWNDLNQSRIQIQIALYAPPLHLRER